MSITSCDRCGKLVVVKFPMHECDARSCVQCGQVYHKLRNPQFRAGCSACDRRYRAHRRARRARMA